MAPKKVDDDIPEPVSNVVASSSPLLCGASAVVTAALPSYLFGTVHGMPLAEWYWLVVPCTLVAIVALFISYGNLYNDSMHSLVASSKKNDGNINYKKVNMSASEIDALKNTNLTREATAWTLLVSNLLFSATFGFVFTYVLHAVETEYKYGVSMVLASVGTWYLGSLKYSS